MNFQNSARFDQFVLLQGRRMRNRPRVIAFLVGSGDLMNLGTIPLVFPYQIVQGKPVYVSTILSMQPEREVRGLVTVIPSGRGEVTGQSLSGRTSTNRLTFDRHRNERLGTSPEGDI